MIDVKGDRTVLGLQTVYSGSRPQPIRVAVE
jgi:hypothetical protein